MAYVGNTGDNSKQYAGYVNQYAKQYGLDPFLVAGIIHDEDPTWNPRKWNDNGDGGLGLGQFSSRTGKGYGMMTNEDRMNAQKSIKGVAWYLSDMIKQFGYNNGIRAYNGGPSFNSSRIGYDGVRTTAQITNGYLQKIKKAIVWEKTNSSGGQVPATTPAKVIAPVPSERVDTGTKGVTFGPPIPNDIQNSTTTQKASKKMLGAGMLIGVLYLMFGTD